MLPLDAHHISEKDTSLLELQEDMSVSPYVVEPNIPDNAYVWPTYPWCTGRVYAYPPTQDLLPVRVLLTDNAGYYSVTRGRMVGVFLNANLASEMVSGISNPANKRYAKQGDALAAFNKLRRDGQVAIALPRESRPQLIVATNWGHVVALIIAGLFGFFVAMYREPHCE